MTFTQETWLLVIGWALGFLSSQVALWLQYYLDGRKQQQEWAREDALREREWARQDAVRQEGWERDDAVRKEGREREDAQQRRAQAIEDQRRTREQLTRGLDQVPVVLRIGTPVAILILAVALAMYAWTQTGGPPKPRNTEVAVISPSPERIWTDTPTLTPTPTNTPIVHTATPTSPPTDTPTPTATPLPPTNTPRPTRRPTSRPTATKPPQPTNTPAPAYAFTGTITGGTPNCGTTGIKGKILTRTGGNMAGVTVAMWADNWEGRVSSPSDIGGNWDIFLNLGAVPGTWYVAVVKAETCQPIAGGGGYTAVGCERQSNVVTATTTAHCEGEGAVQWPEVQFRQN